MQSSRTAPCWPAARSPLSNDVTKGEKVKNRPIFLRGTAVTLLAAVLSVVTTSSYAYATASPGFNSTYYFDSNLYGSHTFTVSGDGKTTVTLRGNYGPAENVYISVEIQTCGFFGCNWNGATVGGTCQRLLYVGGTATCNFNTGNSNNLHRIDMSKVSYGIYIGGDVTIR